MKIIFDAVRRRLWMAAMKPYKFRMKDLRR